MLRLPLIKGSTIHLIDLDNILFITSDRNKIEVQTFNASYRPLMYLKDYLQYLRPNFEQIDKSTLVQITKAAAYDPVRRTLEVEHEGIRKTSYVSRSRSKKIEQLLPRKE